MKTLAIAVFSMAAASLSAPMALADNCTALKGTTWCGTFIFSVGANGTGTATFGTNGSTFTLNGISTGSYICWGKSFLEVDYPLFGGGTAQWLARPTATTISGFGKNTSSASVLYKFTLNAGACAAGPTQEQ